MKLSQHSAKLGQHWADVHQIFQVMDKMVSKSLSIFQELCEFLEVQKRVCLVERKCCKTSVTCKIDFNTAENEPPKVCCKGLTPHNYNYNAWVPYFQPGPKFALRRPDRRWPRRSFAFVLRFCFLAALFTWPASMTEELSDELNTLYRMK